MNPAYESATFLIRSPEWKFLEYAMNLELAWTPLNPDIFFLSRDVTRLNTILFRVRNIQDGAERNVIASLRLGLQFHVL